MNQWTQQQNQQTPWPTQQTTSRPPQQFQQPSRKQLLWPQQTGGHQFQQQLQQQPQYSQQTDQMLYPLPMQQPQWLAPQVQPPQQIIAQPKKRNVLQKKIEVPIWVIILFFILFIVALPLAANASTAVRSITNNAPWSNSSSNAGGSLNPTTPTSRSTVGTTSNTKPVANPTSTSKPTVVSTPTAQSTGVATPGPTSTPSNLAQVGSTLTTGNVACTFVSVAPLKSDGVILPQPGNQFIVVRVKIVNQGSSAYVYSPINFEVLSGSGSYMYEEYGPTTYTANMRLGAGKLASGRQIQGDIIFELPVGDHKAELTWFPNFVNKVNGQSWSLGL